MVKKFISYYKPYKGVFIITLLSAFALAMIALLFPMMIRMVTQDLEKGDISNMIPNLIMMLVLLVIYTMSSFFLSHQGHMIGAKIENDMRQELFAHYQELSLDFYDENKIGNLMSVITNDLYNIGEFAHHFPEDIVISTISLVGSILFMLSINWKIAMIPLIMLPFLLFYAYKTGQKMALEYKKNRVLMSEFNVVSEESLSGIAVVKSFANQDLEINKFEKLGHTFLKNKKSFYWSEILFYEGLEGFILLLPILVLGLGGYLYYLGSTDLTDLMAIFLLLGSFSSPIQKFMHSIMLFQDGTSGFSRFQEFINKPITINDPIDPIEITSVKGNLSFNNVSFSYAPDLPKVLEDVSFEIKQGEYLALVGKSGSGKSTLSSLIARFYDIDSGSIKIDGIDIRDLKQVELRKHIGIVQQDVYLFSGSVLENIRYGLPHASLEEVEAAAIKANAHEFILSLPQGYNTEVGHRGIKLSGGQKQRISIARVFLKDPTILILDEATSSLDNESERFIQGAMEELSKGRTTLVIAHRLATIQDADRILVLDDNKIVEEGRHNQLLDLDGVYAKLYNSL